MGTHAEVTADRFPLCKANGAPDGGPAPPRGALPLLRDFAEVTEVPI